MNNQRPETFYDYESEDALIAAAMGSPRWALDSEFSPSLFTEERRDLAKAIKNLAVQGQELSLINIKAGNPDEKVIMALQQATAAFPVPPSGVAMKPVIAKLINMKIRRQATSAVSQIHGEIPALSGPDIAAKLGDIAITARETLDKESGDEMADGADIADIAADLIRRIERPDELEGLDFGMHELENAIGGLQPGRLVVVAARPHVGKSTFMFNMAANLLNDNKHIAFFTLEMGKREVKQAVLDIMSGVTVRKGITPTKDEIRLMQKGLADMKEFQWRIDDSARLPIDRIMNKARKLHHRKKLDALFVDYIQIISPSDTAPGEPRIAIIEITAKLKELSKELGIPVVTASQINRAIPKTNPETGKLIFGRPALSQMRESASIESDADVVIAPHREIDDEEGDEIHFDTLILKNRQTGIIEDIPMLFDKTCRRMTCRF